MAQIGPQSYVDGNGSTGVPMEQASINPSMAGPRGITQGGAQPVSRAPGGDFRSGAAADAEAIDTIVKFGHSILAPMVERQKQENFWIGVQAASQGNAVEDMVKNQNILDKFMGSSAMVQGARMFTVDSELQKTYSGIMDNMDELRKMGPDEFARHTIGLAQGHMTHDSETNGMIQASMMKQLPSLFQTQAKAHFDWAQDEFLKSGFNDGMAAADNFQRQNVYASTALANGTMSPEEYKTFQASALQHVLAPITGETSETHAKRVLAVIQGQIDNGNLALYNAAKREGSFADMDPSVQLALDNHAQGVGLRRAKEKFASQNPEMMAKVYAGVTNAGSIEEALGIVRAANAQFQIANGAFGDSRYQLLDEDETVKNGAITFARAQAKQAADDQKYNRQQEFDSEALLLASRRENGEYKSLEDFETARRALVDKYHKDGVEMHGMDNSVSQFNSWASQKKEAQNEANSLKAKADAKAEKEQERRELMNNGYMHLVQGLGLPEQDQLKGPEEAAVWGKLVSEQGMPKAMITGTNSATPQSVPYVSKSTKEWLNIPLNGNIAPPMGRFQESLQVYSDLKKDPNGGAAIAAYYGDKAHNMDLMIDLINSDPRWQEHFPQLWNTAFNDGGLVAAQARQVTKADRDVATNLMKSRVQPGILFGTGINSNVRINGAHQFEGYNSMTFRSIVEAESASARALGGGAIPEDKIQETAFLAAQTKADILDGLVIDRRYNQDAPSLQSVISSERDLQYRPDIATRAFQGLIDKWVSNSEGSKAASDKLGDVHVSTVRQSNGEYGYQVTFGTYGSGGLWRSDYNPVGGSINVTPDAFRQEYRNQMNKHRDDKTRWSDTPITAGPDLAGGSY